MVLFAKQNSGCILSWTIGLDLRALRKCSSTNAVGFLIRYTQDDSQVPQFHTGQVDGDGDPLRRRGPSPGVRLLGGLSWSSSSPSSLAEFGGA